ncbi:hypothetical protein NPIL_491311 [Nephila pilipes]|uniref:Uncharacterized protein n=1 Tax=Nephila pilipes TaxID=299642 RepID=A0A8X6R0K7_NEPPI|nr:hypothetical protein NPIL_491311 [Nephila pilipes]
MFFGAAGAFRISLCPHKRARPIIESDQHPIPKRGKRVQEGMDSEIADKPLVIIVRSLFCERVSPSWYTPFTVRWLLLATGALSGFVRK